MKGRDAGTKHQGRKWKYLSYVNMGKLAMYPLLQGLMKNAGLLVQPKVEAVAE